MYLETLPHFRWQWTAPATHHKNRTTRGRARNSRQTSRSLSTRKLFTPVQSNEEVPGRPQAESPDPAPVQSPFLEPTQSRLYRRRGPDVRSVLGQKETSRLRSFFGQRISKNIKYNYLVNWYVFFYNSLFTYSEMLNRLHIECTNLV